MHALRVLGVLLALALAGNAQQCVECEADTFCFLNEMYSCPPHSSSVVRSDNVSACVCVGGLLAEQLSE